MNTLPSELLKEFEVNLTQILARPGQQTDWVLKVMGAKVKVAETFFQ